MYVTNSDVIIYICAGILMSGAIILGMSTTWSLVRMYYYFWVTDFGMELGAGLLFVSAAVLCLPASWIATMIPHHGRSLPMATSLLCLVSVAILLLTSGLSTSAGLSNTMRNPEFLNKSMHAAMAYDKYDYSVRSAFAVLQTDLKCCGVVSHEDWYGHRYDVPPACCGRMMGEHPKCEIPLYKQGCLQPALAQLRSYLNSITTLAYVMVFILSVTLFVTTYIMVHAVVKPTNRSNQSLVRVTYPPPLVPLASSPTLPPYHI